jgi:hypothetical protein
VARKPLALLAPPAELPPAPGQHKCTVRMSRHDYERLGILAVKQGKSRQRLVQEAVGRLFTGMTADFDSSCRCLGASKSD